jgi:hypothetical protein
MKALVCAAALAAGLASSMAQSNVYSLNVVGYYNVTAPAQALTMIANQLNTTNNAIQYVLAPSNGANADGTLVYKFGGGNYTILDYDGVDTAPGFPNGYWEQNGNLDTTTTLKPGEGVFYRAPSASTLTFVGEVLQGVLVNPLPFGTLAQRSSLVPQQGMITTDLGLPGEDGDLCYIFGGGNYTIYDYDGVDTAPGHPNGYWELNGNLNEPVINVGQAFFFKKAPGGGSSTWTRNFTVQ